MNFFGIGGLELLVIGLVAFLVLGPKKMAEAGKSAAKILSELRKQRDELTAAIMSEEPSGREGARREPQGAVAVPRDPLGSNEAGGKSGGESARPGELGAGQDAPVTSAQPADKPVGAERPDSRQDR